MTALTARAPATGASAGWGLRPWARRAFLALAAVAVIWVVVGVVRVVQLHARAGRTEGQITALRTEVTRLAAALSEGKDPGDLTGVAARLNASAAQLASLHSDLGSPLLWGVRAVPLAHRQVESARAITGTGSTLAATAADLATTAQDLSSSGSAHASALSGLNRITTALQSAQQSLTGLALGPHSLLLPSLGHARGEAASLLAGPVAQLESETPKVAAISQVLSGTHQYVFLSANNASMTGFNGRFQQIGWLHIDHGKTTVDSIRDSEQLSEFLKPGTVPITDKDYAANWGWTVPSSFWVTLGETVRFPVVGNLAAQMWSASRHAPVEGAVEADDDALVDIVAATGPVTLAGKTYDADELRTWLLSGQYSILSQKARQAQLRELTSLVVASLQHTSVDPIKLFGALKSAVDGRHLLAYSTTPATEKLWSSLGAAGTVGPNSLVVSSSTIFGKLDPHLHFTVTPTVRPASGGSDLFLSVHVYNDATGPEPGEIDANETALGRTPGTYAGILDVEAPGSATHLGNDGPTTTLGPDGPLQENASFFELKPQQSLTRVFTMHLPASQKTLDVLSSGRDPRVTWQLGSTRRDDLVGFTIPVSSLPAAPATAQLAPDLTNPAVSGPIAAQLGAALHGLDPTKFAQNFSAILTGGTALNFSTLTTPGAKVAAPTIDPLAALVDVGQLQLLQQLLTKH